jgi:hypothetical protein
MKKMVIGAALATAATLAAVVPVAAATLSNGSGQTCDGSGRWHFVNNQTGGQTGPLTATFNVNGGTSTYTVNPSKVLQSVNHYYVTTEGNASLVSASTGSVPGRLVLSDFSCVGDPKKD